MISGSCVHRSSKPFMSKELNIKRQIQKSLLSNVNDNGDKNEKKLFKNMSGNVQGRNFLGGSFPDADIFATAKSLFVKSLLCSILNDYI